VSFYLPKGHVGIPPLALEPFGFKMSFVFFLPHIAVLPDFPFKSKTTKQTEFVLALVWVLDKKMDLVIKLQDPVFFP